MLARLRELLRDPVYRRERRHAAWGRGWLGRGSRAVLVGICYAAFIIAWVCGGVEWAAYAGEGINFLLAGIAMYAAPGMVGSAVALEFDRGTAEALFLTPISRDHIVFAKLFGRLAGLFELYLMVLPIHLATPRPELMGSLIQLDLSFLEELLPKLREARLAAPPISAAGVLLGLKNWLQGATGIYYAGAIGLATALLVKKGKVAVLLSYVGVLFIAGTVMVVPICLVMGSTMAGTLWLAFKGYHLWAVALSLLSHLIFMEILVSLLVPTVVLLFCARRINGYLDAGS